MPRAQTQTGAPKSAWESQTPQGAVPGACPVAQQGAVPGACPVAQQGALLPQVGSPSPDDAKQPQVAGLLLNGAKQPQVDASFPDGAEHLLDAQPLSAAPYPRDALRRAARQPSAPKRHASEAPPFAAPQLDAYCCYRCSSCAHYTTRQAAPPLANAKKLHVVEKMPLNSKL